MIAWKHQACEYASQVSSDENNMNLANPAQASPQVLVTTQTLAVRHVSAETNAATSDTITQEENNTVTLAASDKSGNDDCDDFLSAISAGSDDECTFI